MVAEADFAGLNDGGVWFVWFMPRPLRLFLRAGKGSVDISERHRGGVDDAGGKGGRAEEKGRRHFALGDSQRKVRHDEPHEPIDEDLHGEGHESPDEAIDDGLGVTMALASGGQTRRG